MKNLPWFKFDPEEFWQDTIGLNPEQIGIYVCMLGLSWRSKDGLIPYDLTHIAGYLRITRRLLKQRYLGPVIDRYFTKIEIDGETYLANDKLNSSRQQTDKSDISQRKVGHKSEKSQRKVREKSDILTPNPNKNNGLRPLDIDTDIDTDIYKEKDPPIIPLKEKATKQSDENLKIIQVYDQAIVQVFGAEQARAWPDAKDTVLASRFLSQGADADFCRPIFESVLQKYHQNKPDKKPPDLRYFENIIPEMLADLAKPNPEIKGNRNGKHNHNSNISKFDSKHESFAAGILAVNAGPDYSTPDEKSPIIDLESTTVYPTKSGGKDKYKLEALPNLTSTEHHH